MNLRKLTVLAPSLALMSVMAIAPALASIQQAFPDVGVSAIQLLITLPSLVAIPTILLAGKLAGMVTKKKIVCIALALMLLGGALPFFFHGSYGVLVAFSVVFGVGFGLISPMSSALINEHFSPEEQPALLGFQSAVIGLGNVLFSFIGGQLASFRWWYAYLTFLLLLPVLLFALRLPKGAVVGQQGGNSGGLFNCALVFYLCQCMVGNLSLNAFNTNISMHLEQTGLGGSGTAGAVTAVFAIFGILGGALTGAMMARLKKYTLAFVYLLCGLGLLAVCFGGSLPMILLAAALIGYAYSMRMPAGYTKATMSAPPGAATMAISIYCCASQTGQFLSPLVVNPLSELIAPGSAPRFLVGVFIILLLMLVTIFKESRSAGEM